MAPPSSLTVAVTGVTGTVGRGLLPLLEADTRIERVIGITSRTPDGAGGGFAKLELRRADVRQRGALRRALRGADVVVHLAFALYGLRQRGETLERINVEGSRNVLAAAAAEGARRFLYTSSAAVYGFSRQRPVRVSEHDPVDPPPRHFYSRQKAAVERALLEDLERHPGLDWIFFRPGAVVGPHALGAAGHAVPETLRRAAAALVAVGGAAGLRPAVPAPPVPLQFVHERDVGQAIRQALTTRRSGRVYNLAGDGMVDPADVPRLVGLRTLPLPRPVTQAAVDAASRLPYVTPALGWTQLLRHPLELDTTRARRELRWRPEFSSAEALASTRRALGL